MKLIVLIALFAVGVTSDQPEATSAPIQQTQQPTATQSTPLKTNNTIPNRRDGVSYSTSVIHRDPKHPELEAASSINFRLNTDGQSERTTSSPSGYHPQYSTPNSLYIDYQHSNDYSSHSAEDSASGEDQHQPQADVIYGHNSVGHPQASHQEIHQTHAGQYHIAHQRQNHDANVHPNHQPYYKPITYAQPVLTETKHKIEVVHPTPQYKYTTTSHKTLSTPRPRTTPQAHSSQRHPRPVAYHSGHQQHQHEAPRPQNGHPHISGHQSRQVPIAQAYTQVKEVPSSKTPKAISSFPKPQHLQQGPHGQTQSFNVGYSVKFGNDPNNHHKKQSFKAPRHESDIITGSHKEQVSKPSHFNFHDSSKTFTYAASNPQQIISQANLSPNTQKQLAFLEKIQSQKYPQKEPIQSNFPWKNLSPSVEIYKSKEISLPGSTKNSYGFDHEKAIGKSEGFDYTNAVDYMQQMQALRTSNRGKGTIKGDVPTHTIAYLPSQDTQQVQLGAQVHLQDPQINAQTPYLSITDPGTPEKIGPLPKLPLDTSLLREPFLTVHKAEMQEGQASQGSKLPIHFDTSLIQEMNQGYQNIFNGNNYNPQESSTGASFTENLAQFNNLLAEQSQHHNSYQQLVSVDAPQIQDSGVSSTQTESHPNIYLVPSAKPQDLEMTFAYPQNGLFNPNLQSHVIQGTPSAPQESYLYGQNQNQSPYPTSKNPIHQEHQHTKPFKMYKVKENIQDHVQPQQLKFKVFGKPGNAFMQHQFEKMRRERERPQSKRPQSKRLVREYSNIEMDLRPPPMAIPYKTANYIRIKQ